MKRILDPPSMGHTITFVEAVEYIYILYNVRKVELNNWAAKPPQV